MALKGKLKFILIEAAAVAAVGISIWLANRKTAQPSTGEDLNQFRQQAEAEILKDCTNQVEGLRRIIGTALYTNGPDPAKWGGSATIEFENPLGGLEVTNLFFGFYAREDASGRTNLYAVPNPGRGKDNEENKLKESLDQALGGFQH